MKLHELKPAKGSKHSRKRVGRGPGSGLGKTAGKGHKGQKSRSGYRHNLAFEGGQMPLVRRVPKRGFNNDLFRVEYAVVNVGDLVAFAEAKEKTVTAEALVERGLAHRGRQIKILGNGELKAALRVVAHKFSASARAKIEAAGGSCEERAS
jgi:large subunit ribosomal protein L15